MVVQAHSFQVFFVIKQEDGTDILGSGHVLGVWRAHSTK